MAKSLRTLLENALYRSVRDRQVEPIDEEGSEITVALGQFIDVLDTYRQEVPFGASTSVVGIENLSNFPAASVRSVLYLLGTIKYDLAKFTRAEFSTYSAATSVRSIPGGFFYDEALQQIKIYPVPSTASTDTFFIDYAPLYDTASLKLDLSIDEAIVPRYMQLFLEYELALYLCNEYSVEWTPQKEMVRKNLHAKLAQNSEYRPFTRLRPAWGHRGLPGPLLTYLTKGA